MQLGVTRAESGPRQRAQPCFRAAIRAKPNLGVAWFNLGLSLGGGINDRAESIAAFREAIRLKPDLVEAYLGLARGPPSRWTETSGRFRAAPRPFASAGRAAPTQVA